MAFLNLRNYLIKYFQYNFNTEEVLEPILTNVSNKAEEILTFLNSKFDTDEYYLRNLDWNIKTILSAKMEDYLDSRYSDLEFNMTKSNKGKNSLSEVKNVLITFTKNDVEKAFIELSRIKENLKIIGSCIENLNSNNSETYNS